MICTNDAPTKLQPYPALNTCSPARRQPHLAEIWRWRRQSVQMGRKICVCLSRCNPWRDISSGVGNSSAQTVDDHVLVNGRTRKRSAAGGMERGGSLCGRVADPREPLLGRQCCSIGKKMRMLLWSKGANSGSGGYDVECEEDDHSVILELELGEVLPYFTLTLYSGSSFSKYLAFLRILTTSSFGSAFITFPL